MTSHVKKLSAKKQKLSLGEVTKAEKAKAAANRKIIRATVVNPNDVEWPSLSDEDEQELLSCLTTDLQCLRFPNYHVPLSEIKKVEKGDRRKFRHIWHTERALEVGFDVAAYTKLRADISLGVNCVSTALEQNVLIAVIIEKDVDPPIITKLLVPLATSKEVPIVAISGLNQICQKVFNTRCIALGLKASFSCSLVCCNAKCSEVGHAFSQVFHVIQSISEKKLASANQEYSILYIPNIQVPPTPASSDPEVSQKQVVDAMDTTTTQNKKPRPSTTSSPADSFNPPKIRKV
ncbi:Ribonuclease P protein subunit p38 [Orchesella cincta]|uniref:Ribonuclease P protein subunit p38 n=1 Tax=Orchesella cincta TaxID=48709 RepID=A0A1D2NFK4_ORCCI|nr:Ribonuclease P protein subunit p38 [Orchesella cincta]